jgi:hypothetical protein
MVGVGVMDRVGVREGVLVLVGVRVRVTVGVEVLVDVGVKLAVEVGVAVPVGIGVAVGVEGPGSGPIYVWRRDSKPSKYTAPLVTGTLTTPKRMKSIRNVSLSMFVSSAA